MGKFIDDRYEAEFTVQQSVAEVWATLQKRNERELAWLSAFPRMPPAETTGEVIASEPPHYVRVRKHSEPCKDTDIAVSLTEVDNGTRVLVVQSGFPAWVKESLETFTIGGDQIVNDLILYLERGVEISRHSMPWAFAGFAAQEVGTGLEVSSVIPGTFAANVGLQSGDLLMTLAGAPVYTQVGLQAMLRLLKHGEETEASWVRGRALQTGSSAL